MKSFDLDVQEAPGHEWRRRLMVLVVGSLGYVGMLATWPASSLHTAATPTPTDVPATTLAAAPVTTTTVDPKAIAAGVTALLSHEGATPQELASAPSSVHRGGGIRHVRSGGIHVHG